ncbi:MAG: hypothetical protein Q7U59_05605 [Lutibacter sp.]|nr:hypothetical protein [Lutibacter sp.]MDP3359086.1 hypothetical protein [Lutibacter sp.]
MKQIDFTISENVVNMATPKKINIVGEYSYGNNGSVLLAVIDKKNRFNSKKNKGVNNFSVFSKNFEAFVSCESYPFLTNSTKLNIYKAMPREISIRINN